MAKLWRRYRDVAGKSRLDEVDLSDFKISKPTVVFLSGFLTINKRPGFVVGGIKHLEELLGDDKKSREHVDIYAWSHKSLGNLFNMVAYNTCPHRASSGSAKKLARGVILPLVAKDIHVDENGRLKGVPLPESEARANLKNLTFMGYSAGTILAQETFNASRDMLQEMGFDKKYARSLLNDIVLISTGNMSRPMKEKGRFTTLYLQATNDRLVKLKNRLWLSLKEIFISLSGELTIQQLSENSLLIAAPVRRSMWIEKKLADGRKKLEEIRKLYPKWSMRSSYHELPHYTTNDDKQNEFANIVSNALLNAIRRKGRINVFDLLEPALPLSASAGNLNIPTLDSNAYRRRIKRALQKK